ncbi:LCP family protein [Mumia sp. zg.B53]|uniref:LCP family protein n=1 Tax=unclassified Mumia TaxID=2621872 RepID=UPI001C6ED63E|nr:MULTISPECIES: LCP family protein [unclassified Mumia]MBW9204868.1 LCP family protein [Mumia sp. zg.B17]MBW9213739.1 LCP family protein [Mumia sp. zg.B53]
MPDRDPRRGDGDDFDWLYGPGDDATRVVGGPSSQPYGGPPYGPPHQQPHPGQPQQRPSDLPPMQFPDERRPAATPRRSGGGGGAGRRWLRPRRIIPLLLVAWLIFLIAVPVWAWGKIEKVDATPGGERPADQPGTTYLLVGSDSREGLTKAQRKKLATGNAEGRRTDTIMMMHVGGGPTTLVSIPRDSIVPIPGHGRTKINAAYAYGGPKLLVETLEQSTGVRIDDYVEIGFGGFVNMVDAVGGVEICPKQGIKDKDAGLKLKKGCQEVDGAQALGYARSRHSYATQDLQRVQSQREVLGAIAGAVKSPSTFLNPFRYAGVVTAATDSLRIGDNVGPISLGRFAWSLSAAMGGSGHNCTVPIADASVRWDKKRALELFGYIKAGETDKITKAVCTKDGLPAR